MKGKRKLMFLSGVIVNDVMRGHVFNQIFNLYYLNN